MTVNLSAKGTQAAVIAERMSEAAHDEPYPLVVFAAMVFLGEALSRTQAEVPLPPRWSELSEKLGLCIGETESAFLYFEAMEKQPS